MAQTFSDLIVTELCRLVIEEADKELEIIAIGGGIEEYGAYREKVGRIYGYRKLHELLEQARENVEKRT